MRYFGGTIFFLGALIAGAISLFHSRTLPNSVPMHWGLNGQPDRYGSKWEALLFVPLFMLALSAVFGLIGIVSGKRLKQNAIKGLNIVAGLIVSMFLVIHHLILSGRYDSIPKTIPLLLSGLLIVIGFAMKGIEPNPFIGIRVPWTMNSPMVWRLTHERASKLWVRAGVFSLVCCLIGAPIGIPIVIFMGAVLYPVLDSYRISKSV